MTDMSRAVIDKSIICVDPSTTTAGLAMFSAEKQLVKWAMVRPQKTQDPINRCVLISSAVTSKVVEYAKNDVKSVIVLIEMPGAQVRSAAGSGLITLGIGVGMILKHLSMVGFKIEMIHVNKWTRLNHTHCLPKDVRGEMIRRAFPAYATEENDRGLDAADAIGLGAWFLGIPLPPANACGLPPARRSSNARRSGSSARKTSDRATRR
jgi:hypothetical protein